MRRLMALTDSLQVLAARDAMLIVSLPAVCSAEYITLLYWTVREMRARL